MFITSSCHQHGTKLCAACGVNGAALSTAARHCSAARGQWVLALKKRAAQDTSQTRHSTCGYRSLLPTLGAGGRNLRQKPCSLLPSPCVSVNINSCGNDTRALRGDRCVRRCT
jgi:hypothetical protein